MADGLPAAGCLALLWPALPQGFADDETRTVLTREAATLPPIPRLALEVRLAEAEAAVDLHQLITCRASDREDLERHLAQDGCLARLGDATGFLRRWLDDDRLRDEIGEIFLEWDQPKAKGALGPPAIFLPIDRKADTAEDRKARRKVILSVLQSLGVAWKESDAGLVAAFGGPISISHIGVMLGRKSGVVRINYRGVQRGGLADFLTALRWPGKIGRAEKEFDALIDLSDRLTVALDYDGGFAPRIGFELLLDGQPAHEPRWRALLTRFEKMGLCAASRAEALLNAPRVLHPEDADQDWPAAWIISAVRAPPDRRPWFERRLSHLKLTLAEDGRASAKAYLSGQHHWRPGLAAAPARPSGGPSRDIATAAEAAVSCLLAGRRQNGLWCDFRIANGVSDEWVSAFVACALAEAGGHGRQAAVETASRLAERERSGGWGYNAFSPPDADSTAWVLKLLTLLGERRVERHPARVFLESHLTEEAGFATYARATPLTFDGDRTRDDRGWRGSHLCVAANAAAVIDSRLGPWLADRQAEDGSWPSYWWKTDAMSTALAAEALSPTAPEAVTRAVAWARDRLKADDLTAFDMAWLIRLLRLGDAADRASAVRTAAGLASMQLADGSWPAGAQMLFPPPNQPARDPGAAVYLDEYRMFTTAAVLSALNPYCPRAAE